MDADHARLNPVAHHRPCQHLPACIPDAHHVAVRNPAGFRIKGIQGDRLSPGDRIPLAQGRIVKLAVQTVRGMR